MKELVSSCGQVCSTQLTWHAVVLDPWGVGSHCYRVRGASELKVQPVVDALEMTSKVISGACTEVGEGAS